MKTEIKITDENRNALEKALGLFTKLLTKPNDEGELVDEFVCTQRNPISLFECSAHFSREEIDAARYIIFQFFYANEIEGKYGRNS